MSKKPTFTLTEEPVVIQGRGRNRGGRHKSGLYGKVNVFGKQGKSGTDGESNRYGRGGSWHGGSDKDVDPSDGNGSLTYSASSSVHSQSSTGESTDSSFADIMRVLDMDEDAELANLIARGEEQGVNYGGVTREELYTRQQKLQNRRKQKADSMPRVVDLDNSTISDSLRYSTASSVDSRTSRSKDVIIPQTFTGQPSDSHGPDGGGLGASESGIVFQPAGHHPSKQRPLSSRNKLSPRSSPSPSTPIRSLPVHKQQLTPSSTARKKSALESRPRHANSTPSPSQAPKPRGNSRNDDDQSNRQLWYSQWWMCGFTDALNLNDC